jgi:hypothetical protein
MKKHAIVLNQKQYDALSKLPAIQNEKGAPIGTAKFSDGTTLNGNMINKLQSMGFIEHSTIRHRDIYVKDIRQHRQIGIVEYRITESGKKALDDRLTLFYGKK